MSTQTKALLLVAMLCFAHAERDERVISAHHKLQHILQAKSEVSKINENMSQTNSKGCDALQVQVTKATQLLGKGTKFNFLDLALLMKEFLEMTKSISSGCKLSHLEPGAWEALKQALQTLAPHGLPSDGQVHLGSTDAEVVANTFSLSLFGKLWKDAFPDQAIPSLDAGVESSTAEEAELDTLKTEQTIMQDMNSGKFKQTDPFDRLVLLESGSNTSQLISSQWNPLAFVGGIIGGLITLIVAILCSLLNVVNTVLGVFLNGVFGSIFCLIKKAVQMKDQNPQGFFQCMKTNWISKVFQVSFRCFMACGVWGLKSSEELFKLALDVKDNNNAPFGSDVSCIEG